MIKKITLSEYLKRYDNMDAGERLTIAKRVGEWLRSAAKMLLRRAEEPEAQLQNVMQVSGRWNDEECRAWEEGARLLSSFSNMADTWLPDRLYGKSAYRSIRRMVKCLNTMGEPDGAKPVALQGENVVSGSKIQDSGKAGAKKASKEESAAGTSKATQTVGAGVKPQGNKPEAGVIPRPPHISQYVHILPKKTQERAAKYGELMRALEEARENMRLLMNDPNAINADREKWAKTATRIDSQVKSIRKELDAEWAKAVKAGRVTVDDLGQAHVLPAGEPTGTEVALTKEQKARVKQLRNALRDTRGPKELGEKHDAYVKKWVDKYREMVKIGGPGTVTEAVANSAKLYGIDLDQIKV